MSGDQACRLAELRQSDVSLFTAFCIIVDRVVDDGGVRPLETS